MHDGYAGATQLVHCLHDALAPARVEQGSWFVEDQHLRLHSEGSGYSHALLLAPREPLWVCLGEAVERHAVQLLSHAPLDLVRLHSQIFWSEGDIISYDARDDLVFGILEHKTNAAAGQAVGLEVGLAVPADVIVKETHISGVRGYEAAQHRGERGLA
jgi:hypothetical protein